MTFAAAIARERPDEVAVRDAARSLSWLQADQWLRGTTSALQLADLGPDHRVAIVAGNSADTLLAYVACTLAGASAVAVNSHLTPPEVAYILSDSRAHLVLADSQTAAVAAEAASLSGGLPVVAWGGGPLPPGVAALSDWAQHDAEPRLDVTPRRTLVYTSGTTGRPKGVELPHTSWAGGADISEHLAKLADNKLAAYGRHLAVGPMYHSGPLTATRLFAGGVPVTVLGKFDAERLLAAIERDRIGSSIMVPTHFQRLLALPEHVRLQADTSSLRYVLQVGAKCPIPVKQAMIDWLGPLVWESYGASEVGTTCMISAEEWLARRGSVGRAIPPFEAFIKGPDGSSAAPNTEGALWFRDTTGHGVAYTTGTRSGPEFTLGEIGKMDEAGYVWITDRQADLVVSGGVNIYPAEIEQALSQHPDVADIACFGAPDDAMGEMVVAFVVAADPDRPPAFADLDRFGRQSLAGYKIPKELYLVEQLPHTPVGKFDKRAMRSLHQQAASSLRRLDKEKSHTR